MGSIECFNEPDGAAKRRLWFLQVLVSKMDPEKALALAARMETFVATGGTLTIVKEEDERRSTRQIVSSSEVMADPPEAFRAPCPPAAAPVEVGQGSVHGRLLKEAEIQEFMATAALGATNRDLAQRFGLTPRQANGIRMGLAKRAPQVALKRAVAVKDKHKEIHDRAVELQMQHAFLQRKPTVAPTLEDVVRFLRQRGDVVTRSGDDFTVNNRLTLTPQELVRRANEKRTQLGQPPFPTEVWSVRPSIVLADQHVPASSPAAGGLLDADTASP